MASDSIDSEPKPTLLDESTIKSYSEVLLDWKSRMDIYVRQIMEIKARMEISYMKFRTEMVGDVSFLNEKGQQLWAKYKSSVKLDDLIKEEYEKLSPDTFIDEIKEIKETKKQLKSLTKPKSFASWILPSLKTVMDDTTKTIIDVLSTKIKTLEDQIEIKRQAKAIVNANSRLQLIEAGILKKIDTTKEKLISPYQKFEKDLIEFKDLLDQTHLTMDNLVLNANISLSNVQKEISELITQINALERIISENEHAWPKQGTPEFGLRLFLMFSDIIRMEKPPIVGIDPVIESKCANPCEPGSTPKISPETYQTMLSNLLSPIQGKGRGLLAYHDVGTGKTCTALLFIQTYYMYLLQELKNNPASADDTIPSALVLLPSASIMKNYKNDLLKGCVHDKMPAVEVSKILRVKSEGGAGTKTTTEWHLLDPISTNPVLRVVIHVMQNQLDAKYHTLWKGKGSYSSDSVVPDKGIIIVDEAHNLINSDEVLTTAQGKKRVLQYASAISKTNLPVLLMTATPVLNYDKFYDLLLLIDLIRDTSLPPLTAKNYEIEKTSDEYKKLNADAIAKFFFKDDYGYHWRPKKEKEFQNIISGYVSFFTLKNDPRRYPRVVSTTEIPVPWTPLRFNKAGEVVGEETLSKEEKKSETHSDRNPLKWQLVRQRLYENEKHFLFSPRQYYFLMKEGLQYLFQGYQQLDLSFLDFKAGAYDDTNTDWVKTWFESNPPAKRWCFLGKLHADEDNETVKNRNHAFLTIFNHCNNVLGEWVQCAVGNIYVKEGINLLAIQNVHILAPPPTRSMLDQAIGRALRFCSFSQLSKNPLDWNIKLFMYVAPKERDLVASLRFDKYKYGSVIDYDITYDNPVELALNTLKKGSVDCLLYQNMTGIVNCSSPHSLVEQLNQTDVIKGVCENPLAGGDSLIALPYYDGTVSFEYYCSKNGGIPGGKLLYTDSDALVYLAIKDKYTPKPLSDMAILLEANELIDKGRKWRAKSTGNIFEKAGSFIYRQSAKIYDALFPGGKSYFYLLFKWKKHTPFPFLAMTPIISPEELLSHIERSNPEIGNCILYLLERKRALSSPEVVEKIDKKVQAKTQLIKKYSALSKTFKINFDKLLEKEEESKKTITKVEKDLTKKERSVSTKLDKIRESD